MRPRALRPVLAAALIAVTTAACSATTDGRGTVGALSVATRLGLLLEPAPSGSHPGSTAWDRNASPTVDQFTAEVYPSSVAADVSDRLRSQGITAIAHRVWFTADGAQGDIVLLAFAGSTGAEGRYAEATQAKKDSPLVSTFPVPGADEALGTYEPAVDKYGNIRSVSYARKNNVVVELFSFSSGRLHKAELIRWLTGQLKRL